MHCTLSLTVCMCTPCQRASFNSTTDSSSWGHDPYTLACKARPSFDRCWNSLSVFIVKFGHLECSAPERGSQAWSVFWWSTCLRCRWFQVLWVSLAVLIMGVLASMTTEEIREACQDVL